MLWRIRSIDLSVTPSREGMQEYYTEAAFEAAVKDKLLDPKTRVISAIIPGNAILILFEDDLRRRYRSTELRGSNLPPVAGEK
jgi:hypothetical protein